MTPLDLFREEVLSYDTEDYREILLEAAETVLGYFGFDSTIYDFECDQKEKWKVRRTET